MKQKNFIFGAALAATLVAGFTSCSSSDDDNNVSNNQIDDKNVVADDASALSLVNGVYSHWQPLSSSFSFIIELNSNKLISFEGEESKEGPLNSRFEQAPDTWYQPTAAGYRTGQRGHHHHQQLAEDRQGVSGRL